MDDTPTTSNTLPATAERWLVDNHPAFEEIASKHGPCTLSSRAEGLDDFQSLARSIIYQQLAGKAAATIFGRFTEALNGEVTPEAVSHADHDLLRSAGLSNAKALSVKDLAAKVVAGELDFGIFETAGEDEIVDHLIRVRGIGRWTAQMYLMFTLNRLDVWPSGDLGVQKGYSALYGLDGAIGQRELEVAGEKFRPYRSIAAWYLWRVAEDHASKVKASSI